MAELEDIEDVYEGWLERPADENASSKGWIKKSFSKKWKKSYYVLRKYSSTEQPFMQRFDKEEGWRRQMPKGTLELYPKYRVYKRPDTKGKQHVFEVGNDVETFVLCAGSETVMDLWCIQLQMQTKLNPRVAGKTFRVKASNSKQMQRIGAKDQQCLIHVSKWGVTLALERSRAVVAQWPLTTIRTYESADHNEFTFEAGRRAPMGQGKYTFLTAVGEDNKLFDAIDEYASARLHGSSMHGDHRPASSGSLNDEEMNRLYDQLRFSVVIPSGEGESSLRSANQNIPGGRPSVTRPPVADSYNHIERSNSQSSQRSTGSFSRSIGSPGTYDRIERLPSWGSAQGATAAPMRPIPIPEPGSYDRLDHIRSLISDGGYDRIMTGAHGSVPPTVLPVSGPTTNIHSPHLSGTSQDLLLDSMSSPSSHGSDIGVASPFNNLTDSGEYQTPPKRPPLPEKSRRQSEPTPPLLPPERSASDTQRKASDSPHFVYHSPVAETSDGYITATNVATSPNFTYLNRAYSSSVEVLPHIYSKVDKDKKMRDRSTMEKAFRTRTRSKSFDDNLSSSPKYSYSPKLSGSPIFSGGSPAFSGSPEFPRRDFLTTGNGSAGASSSEGDLVAIDPKQPEAEVVAVAVRSSLSHSDISAEQGDEAYCRNLNGNEEVESAEVQELKRALSQLSGQREKKS